MMKHICLVLVLALAGCAAVPPKYQSRKIAFCQDPSIVSLAGVPYRRLSKSNCAAALAPFDIGFWHEAPFNSRMVRGQRTVKLGCRPLTPEGEDSYYSGLPGSSRTAVMNFDLTVYPEEAGVQRAVLAVYAFSNPRDLHDEAQLRGRLNVGDQLQSLARQREAWTGRTKADKGWVLFDVTAFAARAINERRNSVHFEISRPCLAEGREPAEVGLLRREPRLVVEFK